MRQTTKSIEKLHESGELVGRVFTPSELSNEIYHLCIGVSASHIREYLDSPALYYIKYILGIKPESSKAMVFGSMFHSYILEPKSFDSLYKTFVKQFGTGSQAVNKAAIKSISDAGQTPITSDDITLLETLSDAIKVHDVGRLIQTAIAENTCELSYFWVDSGSGLLCKCRVDAQIGTTLLDLKSTGNIIKIEKDIANFRYYIQSTFYPDGFEIVTGKKPEFAFVFIDKRNALIDMVTLDFDADEFSRNEYKEALLDMASSIQNDYWPVRLGATPGECRVAELPGWVFYNKN